MLTVRVLGPVEVERDGQPVELGGPQQRAVVAHLALEAGRVVSVERLVDRLWGDDPPRTTLGTLQSYVSRLRRAIEPDRSAGASPKVLVSEAPGYLLRLPLEQIDVHQFRSAAGEARAAATAGDHVRAVERFDAALALWRGPALAGVGPEDQVRSIVVRLDEERDAAIEDRFAALLELGRHAEAVPRLQAAVDELPMRERLWALLALALYRSSRQADALRALSTARTVLLDQLGLDPGPELRDLERRILAQDPTLALRAQEPVRPETVAPARAVTAPSAGLVGRDGEWAAMVAARDAAARGRAQLVLVEGEPGIGKSTLCDAFVAHAATGGWSTAVGRCVEPGLAPSLWPCLEIVRAMVGGAGPAGDEHGAVDTEGAPAAAVPAAGASDAPGAARTATVNLWRRMIDGGAGVSLALVEMADQFVALIDELGHTGWVIMLDDLHWADRATLDVIRLTLERLASRPVLVIGALRPPELVPGSLLGDALGGLQKASVATTRIRMSALDAGGVAQLMELTAGVAPSSELADRVQARTGGNPLFVAELARLAGERGLSDESVVPEAIRDVVRGRLAGLPERATAELEVAAVLGERFDLRTAMAASERDPDGCLDALDAAIVTRILVPQAGGFRFAHALVRDAVLAEISTLRLARLHHRAAEAIIAVRGDGPDEAEPIAHHRLAAVAFADPVIVAKSLVRASDVARWRSALDNADRLADQALQVLAEVPRTPAVSAVQADALEAIISAAYRRDDPVSVATAVQRVSDMADRPGNDAAVALSLFLSWRGIDEAEDLTEVAEPVARARVLAGRTTDTYAIVTARYMLASYSLLLGRIDEAAEHTAIAIDASGAPNPDDRPEHVPLVLLPVVAGMVAALQGDASAARDHAYRRARAWLAQRSEVDPTADVALAFNRGLIHALLGEAQAVLEQLRDAPRIEEGGFIGEQSATCDVLTGWARVQLGDGGGLEQAAAAMARIERSPELTLRSCLRSFVADACLTLGDPRAVALLEQACSEARSRREAFWLSETIRLQAEADLCFGDGAAAGGLLDQAEQLATGQGALLTVPRIAATRARMASAPVSPR